MDDRVRALFGAANFAHLATRLPDGGPHSVPVWAGVVDERLAFFTQPASRKARNLENDGRVALSVVDRGNPYRSAHVRGRVAQTLWGDDAMAIIDELARKYTGALFPMRSGVVYLVEVTSEGFAELPFADAPPAGG